MRRKQKTKRLHIVLKISTFDEINNIRKRYGINSMKDAVTKAVAVLNTIIEENAEIVSKDGKTKIRIV